MQWRWLTWPQVVRCTDVQYCHPSACEVHLDLFLGPCLCLCPCGAVPGILLFDNLFPFRCIGKTGIKSQISPEYRSSINNVKFSGVSEFNESNYKISPVCRSSRKKTESVAADEMAVKKKAADTNFLEKKIGFWTVVAFGSRLALRS